MKFDYDTMRARFHEAGREKLAIAASVAPQRQDYETARAEIEAKREAIKPIETQLREADAAMGALDRERAMISRLLGGKTGKRAPGDGPAPVVPLARAFGSLDEAKASYLGQLKKAADKAHVALGTMAGISMTYQEKKDQAVAVLGMGAEAANALPNYGVIEFPLVAASVPSEAETLFDAATLIMKRYEDWTARAGALEAKRIACETQIRSAGDVGAVRAAFESTKL
jgi:predicted flap endonuclease-1-like 5' DNA nuclease